MAIQYGIIGTGMMGVEHILNLKEIPGTIINAIADPYVPSQEAAKRAVGNENISIFDDVEDLLKASLCDILVIASPNYTHFNVISSILAYPKPHHILVEKPLCTTVEDCLKILEASKKRPEIIIRVGLEYRYIPPVNELIKKVRSGTVGNLKMIAIREHRFPFLVKVNNWNRFSRFTGGTLVEKCCHFFDLMRQLAMSGVKGGEKLNHNLGKRLDLGASISPNFGLGIPLRVMASGGQNVNHLDEEYDGEVPDILDNAFVLVDFIGCRASLDLCMFAEASRNEQELAATGDLGKVEAFVPEGIIRVGLRKNGRAGVETVACDDKRIKYEGLHHGASYLEHLDFLERVKSEGTRGLQVSLWDGIMSVAIGVAAQKSIELGRIIEISEVLDVNAVCME